MKMFTTRYLMMLIGLFSGHQLVIAQSGNYFAPSTAGTSNTGSYNTFVGDFSGATGNSGNFNSFLGYASGYNNKAGSYNSFLGSYSGVSNSTGQYNTFSGAFAGYRNSTANHNSFSGYLSGYSTNTGQYNSFFGSSAGTLNSTGDFNTFLGAFAGYNNTTADNNTLIGYNAGLSNTTGTQNTFVGSEAGYTVTTAVNNALLGFQAGRAITTGSGNTILGTLAGRRTTSGFQNVFVGVAAGENNTLGRENTFVGRVAGLGNTTGFRNTALGFFAGPATANLTNATAIGYRALVLISNAIVLGSVNGVNGATSNTRVGIGTNAPGYLLHVNGVAAKPGGGAWAVASDKRLKQQVEPYKEGLSQIMEINPVWFKYNGKAGLPTDKRYVGVIAQDMQKIVPYTVGEFVYLDSVGKEERYLDYDASSMTYMLVNAVKELNNQFKGQIEQQNIMIQQLQQEIAELRKLVGKPSLPGGSDAAARLGQNFPNPYTRSTVIPYYVPETSTSAQLEIYSVSGQEVYRTELMQKGEGEIEISTQNLAAGSYVYHLVVDGRSVDNKKMMLRR